MSNATRAPVPTQITLKQAERILHLAFDDGSHFDLPCRYLRAYSPAAEAKVARERGDLVSARMDVNIESIEPVGTYAVRLSFSDGHDTGVYSWQTLYDLGRDFDTEWSAYLARLAGGKAQTGGLKKLHIHYFAVLVPRLGRDFEEVLVPPTVVDVASLIDYLADRGPKWQAGVKDSPVSVTVNRQFAEMHTPVNADDEIGFVPQTLGME